MGFDFQSLENAGIQLIDGDRGKNYPKHNDFMENGYCLFLSAKNVTKSGFQFQETVFINEIKDSQLRAGKLSYGDIVLTTRGTVGNIAYYDSSNPYKYIRINSGMIIIRADKKLWNSKFLYFILTSGFLQEQIINLISGSAVPQLPARDIKKFILPVIGRNIQDKIANIISAFSDKINLNINTNQTLEQMSQTLFKSWFVDFDPVIDNALDAGNPIPEALQSRAELRQKVRNSADFKPLPADIRALFPAEFEETELGWVPKGWNIDNVGELSENIFSGGTPNTSTEEYWNGTLNWFSSGETRNALIIETEKKITEAGVRNSSTRLSVSGDILIASAGQGHTRGQTSLNTIDTYINQSVVCIRPMKSSYSSWLYFNLSSRYDEMRAISDSHSIRGSLTTKLIASMKVISPTDDLISLFDTNCSTFINKIKNNLKLSCELKKLRDTLLPKLISGELSLEDLPDLIAETEAA